MQNVKFDNADEALETLKIAIEAAAIGIWDFRPRTGELHWSERCREIFGVAPNQALRYEDFLNRLDAAERDHVHAVIMSTLDPDGAGQFDLEYKIIRDDGDTRWASARGRAFFDEVNGERVAVRFLGTILDRTEQRLSQQALIHAEQLAATGRLAASIAHEINNPLEAVVNLMYLAKHETSPELRDTYLTQAEGELARVSEIASNTLRFYRNPTGTAQVDASTLIQSVLSLFHGRLAMCRIEVKIRLEQGTCVVAAQGELRQVLVNLVDNAIDASPKGSKLYVRCRHFGPFLEGRPRGVAITIADTGAGMEPAVLRRISEPFFTTKGASGTGLGLWLSAEILARHGFKMKVKSRPGRGTVFQLLLPALEDRA